MSITAYIIPPHGQITRTTLTDELADLQTIVGGDIEALPLPVGSLCGIINEAGKLSDLDINSRATLAMRDSLMTGDWIAGTMVVIGAPDEAGESTSVPADQMEQLLAVA